MIRHDPVTELDLLAYVDGHLDPARRRVVEAHLANHAEDARRVAADIAINQGIRRIFEGFYQEAPPNRLTTVLRQRPRRVMPAALAAGLAAVIAFSGSAIGWWVGTSSHPSESLARPEPPAVAQEPGGQSLHRLVAHLTEAVRAPDLSAAGFRLVRQDVVGSAGKPTIQLTYADAAGERVDLFLQARSEQVQFRYEEADGRGLLSWNDGPIVYALTGDLSAEELQALGETIHRDKTGPGRSPRTAEERGSGRPQAPAAILPVASGTAR